jgi:hypothetical protein
MPVPDYPNSMFVGYFDYAVLALVIGINAKYSKRYGSGSLGCWSLLAMGLLYCLVLPVLSMGIELERARRPPGVSVDGFEFLYTWLRFPMYWVLFVLQVSFLAIYSSRQKRAAQSEHELD